jgi:biopolymer transport protein TolR
MDFKATKNRKTKAEINVVPLVDIVLVLLIIFMIAAPMMFNGINLQLPKTKKVNQVRLNKDHIVLSYSRSGEYYLGSEKILLKELIPEIKSSMGKDPSQAVYLRADFGIQYGKVAKLIGYLKRNGLSNISLVTEVDGN